MWALEDGYLRRSGMAADEARDAAEEAFTDDLGDDDEWSGRPQSPAV